MLGIQPFPSSLGKLHKRQVPLLPVSFLLPTRYAAHLLNIAELSKKFLKFCPNLPLSKTVPNNSGSQSAREETMESQEITDPSIRLAAMKQKRIREVQELIAAKKKEYEDSAQAQLDTMTSQEEREARRVAQAELGVSKAQARLAQVELGVSKAKAKLAQAELDVDTAKAKLAQAELDVAVATAQAEVDVDTAKAKLAQTKRDADTAKAKLAQAREAAEKSPCYASVEAVLAEIASAEDPYRGAFHGDSLIDKLEFRMKDVGLKFPKAPPLVKNQ